MASFKRVSFERRPEQIWSGQMTSNAHKMSWLPSISEIYWVSLLYTLFFLFSLLSLSLSICVSRNWTLRNSRAESFVVQRNVNRLRRRKNMCEMKSGKSERKKNVIVQKFIWFHWRLCVCVVSRGTYRAIACICSFDLFEHGSQEAHTDAWKRWSAIGNRHGDRSVCATCKYRMTSIMSICWRWQPARLATTLNYCSNASIMQPTSSTALQQERKKGK